jgi:hypothetical protein
MDNKPFRSAHSSVPKREKKEEEPKNIQAFLKPKPKLNNLVVSPMDLALSGLLDCEITGLRRAILGQNKVLSIRTNRLNLLMKKEEELANAQLAVRLREDMKLIHELTEKEVESTRERLDLTHNYLKVLID